MPQSITQPYRSDPTRRLPEHLRPTYPADVHEEAERIARREREAQRAAAPATAITRLDIPFEDVFALALKIFAAQVLIGILIGIPIAIVIWLIVLP